MKHAIIILASYDIESLIDNIIQYKDMQDVFDIFIHIDSNIISEFRNIGYNVIEINNDIRNYLVNKTQMNNIICVCHKYNCQRFSFELLLVEFYMFNLATSYQTYAAYHLTSESCFLYKKPECIVDFFNKHPYTDLIEICDHNKNKAFINHPTITNSYKGSQWISLSNNTLEQCNKIKLFDKIFDDYTNKYFSGLIYEYGAFDEIIFHTYLMKYIYNSNNVNDISIISRAISWYNSPGNPRTLLYSDFEKLSFELFPESVLQNAFWTRKINMQNQDSKKFLLYLKQNYSM